MQAAAAAARVELQQLIPHSPIRDATEWVGVGGERERERESRSEWCGEASGME